MWLTFKIDTIHTNHIHQMNGMNYTHQTQIGMYVLGVMNRLSPFILRKVAMGIGNNIILLARGDIILFTQGGSTLLLAQGCIPLLNQRNSFQGQ
jgi:hypothetical protein